MMYDFYMNYMKRNSMSLPIGYDVIDYTDDTILVAMKFMHNGKWYIYEFSEILPEGYVGQFFCCRTYNLIK